MQHDEKTYIKRSRKPFSFKIFFAVMLMISLITGIAEIYSHNQKQTAAYDNALQSVSQGDFSAAEQQFSALSDYRDSRPLSIYCKYAALYKDRTDYAGGEDVLSTLNLQYDVQLQKDIDTLESRIKGYKAVKDKQIAKELEKKRYDD